MIAAITGSRDRIPTDREFVEFFLILSQRKVTEVWHGDCRRTDKEVGRRCKDAGLEVREFPVDNSIDGPWPAAGPRRNYRMLTAKNSRSEKVELLIAFWGNDGTMSAKNIADSLKIEVIEIERRW